jgi:hypothetical protein
MKIKKLHLVLFTLAIFSFQFLIQKAEAQVCFSPGTNFPVNYNSNSGVSADFNGDGDADLAIIFTNDSSVAIYLGNGAGSFGAVTNFTVGLSPNSIITGDFNGDNFVDLATSNEYSNNLSVIFGDGTGSFSVATNFAITGIPHSLTGGDFNGDNKIDLATANWGSQSISVFLGDGLGGFGSESNFSISGDSYSIISADFNGDNKADLATTISIDSIVVILLGDGTGNFGVPTNFGVGSYPLSLISADFNADGNTDLATANSGVDNVSILLGNGLGSFSVAVNFDIDSTPKSIISADFNGDGYSDLATANHFPNNISVLLGNGTGSFAPEINFMVGNGPVFLICADFNGDLEIDIATIHNYSSYISVLLNFPPPVLLITSPAAVCFPNTINITTGSVTAGSTGGGTLSYWTNAVATIPLLLPNAVPAGIFYIKTTATGGCADIKPVTTTVNPQPTASFTAQDESSTLYCDGSIIANLTGGTGTIQAQWFDSNQILLSSTNSIDSLCQGSYTLNLIDGNLCTNTFTQTLQAGPIPPTPPVCLITVDPTNSHNIVVWEKTNLDLTVIDSFLVYREITTNNYQPLGSVSKDSLSTFDDFAANPATTGYRYKLKSKNTHGVVSLFCDYHNTIYLNNNGANFNWTPYQVQNNTTPVSTYNVYRDDNSTGNFILIGNTTGNQFGYTDVQFASFPDASYYVEAVMASGACQPTRTGFTASRSNVKHFGISGVQQLNNHSVVNIYPNPAGNTLNITGITGKATVLLYDVVGKLVMEKEVENNTILNTSILVDGIYTLLTESKMGRSFNKVVISR